MNKFRISKLRLKLCATIKDEYYLINGVQSALVLMMQLLRRVNSRLLWCRLLICVGLASSMELTAATGAVILQYHHVSSETPGITSISPEKFEAHIQTIINQGYQVLPLADIVEPLRDQTAIPDKAVGITFDDAYVNIYENAYPILKRHKLPFTIFVATDYVGVNPNQYLSWAQLREMQLNGATINNHTASHPHLLRQNSGESKRSWRRRVKKEILFAEQALRENLPPSEQDTLKMLAYPYGEYNPEIEEIITGLGYIAFGQQSGAVGYHSDFTVLPRFPLAGDYTDMASFEIKLNTLPLPVNMTRINPLLPENVTRPTLELQFLTAELNLGTLTCFGPGGRLPIRQIDPQRVLISTETQVPVGRSRYNCTMPYGKTGRFYWFSQLWIRKNDDGSWYQEK